jgi:hypothetical protein
VKLQAEHRSRVFRIPLADQFHAVYIRQMSMQLKPLIRLTAFPRHLKEAVPCL